MGGREREREEEEEHPDDDSSDLWQLEGLLGGSMCACVCVCQCRLSQSLASGRVDGFPS